MFDTSLDQPPNKTEIALKHYWIPVLAALVFGGVATPIAAGAADTREAVQRTDAERDFILDQMRLLLSSIVEIEEGLGASDMDKVAREAAPRGRKANLNLARPPGLAAKESEAWKSMFASVRGGFDTIAEKASAHAPATEINRILGDTMRNCAACHQTYRIETSGH
jgi:cytochrome c556